MQFTEYKVFYNGYYKEQFLFKRSAARARISAAYISQDDAFQLPLRRAFDRASAGRTELSFLRLGVSIGVPLKGFLRLGVTVRVPLKSYRNSGSKVMEGLGQQNLKSPNKALNPYKPVSPDAPKPPNTQSSKTEAPWAPNPKP